MPKRTKVEYLSYEEKRGEWRYQRPVPKALHAHYGAAVVRKWLGDSQSRAETAARKLGVYHEGVFESLKRLSPHRAADLLKLGGYLKAQELAGEIATLDRIAATPWGSPEELVDLYSTSVERLGLGDWAIPSYARSVDAAAAHLYREGQREMALRTTAEHAASFVLKADRSSIDYGWDALFANWKRKTNAKYDAEHPRTIALLRKILGNVDVRQITPHDIDRFLRALPEHDVATIPMQRKIRDNVSGMLRECIPLWRKDNPCKGVKVEGQHKRVKGRPFTGKHIKAIRKAAVAMRYHDDLHEDAMWVLHIQTFMGCRVNEAAQLQKGDFEIVAGVPCVWFREECAETGKKHECKNIKTGDERRVPLHPALWNAKHPRYVGKDIRKFAKGKPGDFVFSFERYQRDGKPKPKGGAQWMIQNGRTLLAAAGITGPGYKPNHSFRHRMNDAMKNAGGHWSSDDEREAFLGHANSVNAGYGGEITKSRAKALWDVDPLSDM